MIPVQKRYENIQECGENIYWGIVSVREQDKNIWWGMISVQKWYENIQEWG
jgi:hypothetical protein